MAAGDLITGEWEFEYRGLLLGGVTDYRLIDTNAGDMPGVRTGDQPRLHESGDWPGIDRLEPRSIQANFEVYSHAGGRENLGRVVRKMKEALVPGVVAPLVMSHRSVADSRVVQIPARARRLSFLTDIEFFEGVTIVAVEWVATDPRYLALTGSSARNIGLTGNAQGLTWPLSWSLEWGSGGSGEFVAVNSGNFPATPTFTIDGPVVRPRIENVDQGRTLTLNLELLEGQTAILDGSTNTVTVNGINRFDALDPSSQWFDIAPPGDLIRFRAQEGNGNLAASWASTWI